MIFATGHYVHSDNNAIKCLNSYENRKKPIRLTWFFESKFFESKNLSFCNYGCDMFKVGREDPITRGVGLMMGSAVI